MIDWSYDLAGAPRNKNIWLTIEFNCGELYVVNGKISDLDMIMLDVKSWQVIAWKPVETKPEPAKPQVKGKISND